MPPLFGRERGGGVRHSEHRPRLPPCARYDIFTPRVRHTAEVAEQSEDGAGEALCR